MRKSVAETQPRNRKIKAVDEKIGAPHPPKKAKFGATEKAPSTRDQNAWALPGGARIRSGIAAERRKVKVSKRDTESLRRRAAPLS